MKTIAIGPLRAVAFTASLTAIVVGCSADAPSGQVGGAGMGTGGTAGSASGMGGMTAAQVGGKASAGSTSAGGMVTTTGGSAGASAGGGGSGGAAAGSGGKAGAGGSGGNGPPAVPQVCEITAAGTGEGEINYERWDGIPGSAVSLIPVNQAPTETLMIQQLRVGGGALDLFGSRMRGYLTAPLDGGYRFWVAGDDNCEVWLSTSDAPANKVRIAWFEGEFSGWTNDQEWNKFPTQKSNVIMLNEGERYYLEVLHKDGVNLDHVSVGWQLPGESGLNPCEIVPGTVLTPFEAGGTGGAGGAGQ